MSNMVGKMAIIDRDAVHYIAHTEGAAICLEGRWAGWLFVKHPTTGAWTSVRKLEIDVAYGDPMFFPTRDGHPMP